jgi:hypothetical protein
MRVLYHAERQAFPGHRDGIHERGQPPPPGIRIDLGQLHIGIGDAHQVIEERQVLGVCIANLGIDLRSGGMRVKTLDAGGRARQPRHDVEGIWLVCDSQKAVNTRAERSALRRDTAVTQAQAVVDLIHAASARCRSRAAISGAMASPAHVLAGWPDRGVGHMYSWWLSPIGWWSNRPVGDKFGANQQRSSVPKPVPKPGTIPPGSGKVR